MLIPKWVSVGLNIQHGRVDFYVISFNIGTGSFANARGGDGEVVSLIRFRGRV